MYRNQVFWTSKLWNWCAFYILFKRRKGFSQHCIAWDFSFAQCISNNHYILPYECRMLPIHLKCKRKIKNLIKHFYLFLQFCMNESTCFPRYKFKTESYQLLFFTKNIHIKFKMLFKLWLINFSIWKEGFLLDFFPFSGSRTFLRQAENQNCQ